MNEIVAGTWRSFRTANSTEICGKHEGYQLQICKERLQEEGWVLLLSLLLFCCMCVCVCVCAGCACVCLYGCWVSVYHVQNELLVPYTGD